jgi:branched-chain amino acid transport system substrate-binding protein
MRSPATTLSVLALFALSLGCGQGAEAPVDAAAPETGPIKIGEYGSLTGATATFGQATKRGVELAVEEINAAGGVKGRMLEVIVEDDQGKTPETQAAVQKLVDLDKVVAVIGEVASTRSLVGAPVCQAAGIPMITPSSTNPKVTEVGDYIFRVCFIDPFQGEVMARFAHDTLGATRAAIVKDVKNDYSVGLSQFFADTFTKLGGEIVSEESYQEGEKDFKGVLTNIKGKNPQVIFVPGYYTDAGLVAQQARELGLTVPLLGGDGWESPLLLEVGGAALDGCYYSNHYFAGAPIPRIQEFGQKYKAKYGEEPDSLTALAYDATNLLAAAMTRAPSLKGSDLRDAIKATKDFPGVCGTVNFDANRNPVKSAVILKIEGGKIDFHSEVGPAAPAPPPADAAAPAEPAAAPAEPAPAGASL